MKTTLLSVSGNNQYWAMVLQFLAQGNESEPSTRFEQAYICYESDALTTVPRFYKFVLTHLDMYK